MREQDRLSALHRYQIIDTPPETAFDDICQLAADIFEVPVAIITFIDESRTWYKAAVGTQAKFAKREETFCNETILTGKTQVVADASKSPAHADNIYIAGGPRYRFYASSPIITAEGFAVGTLCLFSPEVKTLTSSQVNSLNRLSSLVLQVLEARLKSIIQKSSEKQNEFLDTVLESLSDGIVACNELGQVALFNRATREFHGIDADTNNKTEDVSKHYSLFHADGKTLLEAKDIPLFRAFAGENVKDAEMVVRTRGGGERILVCSGRALFDKENVKLGAVVALHDVTEHRAYEAKLEATSHNLQALIRTVPVGILGINTKMEITHWNPACEKIYGWNQEEVVTHVLPHSVPDGQINFRQMAQEVLKTKTQIEVQGIALTRDEKKINIKVSMVPTLGENKQATGCTAVVVDISDLIARETALIETNRALKAATLAKSEFVANMSHEIRTPLNGILGMTDLVLDSEIDAEQRKYLELIKNSGDTLLTIVSDILDFSKVEAGKLEIIQERVFLKQMIQEVHRTLEISAQKKGLHLCSSLDRDLEALPILADPLRVQQVLSNLVSNAIKFTKTGEVKISASLENKTSTGPCIRIEVKDTGIGISESGRERLFKAFSQADTSTTRKFGGTGLGLSISKNLVNLMGGEIGVESVEHQGSTFWFTLPLAA